MTILRVIHDKSNPYVQVNKTIITDNRLSWKAKGIWLYAFSRPDDWQFYLADLVKQSTNGRDSVKKGLRELQECGYLFKIQGRNEKKQFEKSEWCFFEIPQSEEEIKKMFPMTENPSTEVEMTENRPLLKKEVRINKKDNNPPPEGGGSETPSRVVIFRSLNSLDIDDEAKENISKHHKEDAVNLAVDRCLKWKGRPNDAVGVMTALRKADQWEDVLEKEDVIEKNKEWLKNHAQLDGKTINNYQCQISPEYILFFGGAVSKAFKADNPNMVKEAMDWLKKKQ